MKKLSAILSFLFIIAISFYSFYSLMPQSGDVDIVPANEFSIERSMRTLIEISKEPHYLGSPAHEEVRKLLISELRKLGFDPHIQEGFSLNPSSKTLNKPINIVARMEGTERGKALLLLSHYDSAPVPSYGASDDASGLVTILEGFRAYLASGKRPKNDIIILFSDAEELGLDGAKLFINEHPWAKDVGLVLNFEARGTSGPSNMIVETNGGNSNLIAEFIKANPQYPVASSLMYSVYKMLPNDTDSTIFREDADIDSFFFAFIDDHFNYHTANDNIHNLDTYSLAHQGSYLLSMLHHFADADLTKLKSTSDNVYVNFPIVKMISYPFSWIWPMIIIACIVFLALIFYGFKKRRFNGKSILIGFAPLITTLLISGIAGYYGWKLLIYIYPQYTEIQQGFTYNGHWYIAFFVSLSLAISFAVYKKFNRNRNESSLYVAPLFLWILINIAVAIFLKGAAFFIIPVFFGLLSFYIMLRQGHPNLLAMAILATPALAIFVPLIQFFPVGLGLKMLVISCIFTVLVFGLLLSVVSYYRLKKVLSILSLLFAVFFFIKAHSKSDFSENRKKPNSLLYYEDADSEKAFWVTYDKNIDVWTKKYLGEKPDDASMYLDRASYSKYGFNYTFATETPKRNILPSEIVLMKDSVFDNLRNVHLTIIPKRRINKLELYSANEVSFIDLKFNGKNADVSDSNTLYRGTLNLSLINYYVSPNDSLKVDFTVKKDTDVSFKLMEYSFDLMDNPNFNMEKRLDYMMPKPFVATDATVLKHTFSVDSLRVKPTDSIKSNSNIYLENE